MALEGHVRSGRAGGEKAAYFSAAVCNLLGVSNSVCMLERVTHIGIVVLLEFVRAPEKFQGCPRTYVTYFE